MTETEQTYDTILVETKGRVGIITLNRPQALNALNSQVLADVLHAARAFDADDGIGAILLTGSEKAFAAGADIKEMADRGFAEMFATDWFAGWQGLAEIRTPTIAAVSGYALGGGCELAMLCDLLIASETAKFGQPEINLGVLPGMGGSQRLTRAIGRPKAMDMVLTGRQIDAQEAERAGLVSRVIPADEFHDESLEIAQTIASKSLIATMAAKEAVHTALETPLSQGLVAERRLFHGLFATEDQKEGMAAFIEKRDPEFKHR